MHIAFASCATLPAWEVDDRALQRALERRGAAVATHAWDDATVDWETFDACLIRSTWDYMERRTAFVAWAAGVGSALFNPATVVEWNTLKTYLRELGDAGERIAPTKWLEAGTRVNIAELLAGEDWAAGFLKPLVGAGARATLPFTLDSVGLARAQAHLDAALPVEGFMVQPFLEAVGTEGEYSVIFIAGCLTHAVRKVPVPGDYRVMDDFGARDERCELPAEDIAMAHRVRERCEAILGCAAPLLYARVDLLRDSSGQLVVNEVELVEPTLFFRHAPDAAERLADAVLERVG